MAQFNGNNNYRNNSNRGRNDLTSTNCTKEPDIVGYTFTSSEINEFFGGNAQKGITGHFSSVPGFKAFRIWSKREANQTRLMAFLFLDADSEGIVRSTNVQNPLLRGQIEQTSEIKGSLYNELKPFTVGEPRVGFDKKNPNMAYVEMDPFNLLGFMLNANPQFQEIVITNVDLIDRRSHEVSIRVAKRRRNVVSDRDIRDVYEEVYNSLK